MTRMKFVAVPALGPETIDQPSPKQKIIASLNTPTLVQFKKYFNSKNQTPTQKHVLTLVKRKLISKLKRSKIEKCQALKKHVANVNKSVPTKSKRVCNFLGCGLQHKYNPNIHFFRFPVKKPAILEQWLVNSGNEKLINLPKAKMQWRRLCEKHFEIDCFSKTVKRKRLKKDAVPTISSKQIASEKNVLTPAKRNLISKFKSSDIKKSQAISRHLAKRMCKNPEDVPTAKDQLNPKSASRNSSRCCFLGCGITKMENPNLHFFRFPVNRPTILKQWLVNCGDERLIDLTNKELRRRTVCEKHFEIHSFTPKRFLKKNAVPIVKLNHTSSEEILDQPDPSSTVDQVMATTCDISNDPAIPVSSPDRQPIPPKNVRTHLKSKEISLKKVCEKHFKINNFHQTPKTPKMFLKRNAVPNVQLGRTSSEKILDQLASSSSTVDHLLTTTSEGTTNSPDIPYRPTDKQSTTEFRQKIIAAYVNNSIQKKSRYKCCFLGCGLTPANSPNLRFFKFFVKRPTVTEKCIINRGNESLIDLPNKTSSAKILCEKHFELNCFKDPTKQFLKIDSVPTSLGLNHTPEQTPDQATPSPSRFDLLMTIREDVSNFPDLPSSPIDKQSTTEVRRKVIASLKTPETSQYKKYKKVKHRTPMPQNNISSEKRKLLSRFKSSEVTKFQAIRHLSKRGIKITKSQIPLALEQYLPPVVFDFFSLQLSHFDSSNKLWNEEGRSVDLLMMSYASPR